MNDVVRAGYPARAEQHPERPVEGDHPPALQPAEPSRASRQAEDIWPALQNQLKVSYLIGWLVVIKFIVWMANSYPESSLQKPVPVVRQRISAETAQSKLFDWMIGRD